MCIFFFLKTLFIISSFSLRFTAGTTRIGSPPFKSNQRPAHPPFSSREFIRFEAASIYMVPLRYGCKNNPPDSM
ncbi:hypothetical protein QLX67_09200 [Balneolaceae bacterium ANBcel3]|nr:hypothetical protein [Balneolaceae bacterium ANBcel3]